MTFSLSVTVTSLLTCTHLRITSHFFVVSIQYIFSKSILNRNSWKRYDKKLEKVEETNQD